MNDDSTRTVLTIDDDDPFRQSIAGFLEDYDYRIIEANNGREGVELFRDRSPDLVLVDLRMPGLNGLEVLKIIRQESAGTPVIVISGTGDISTAVEALRLGAWDYILKPIQDMGVLLHAVEKVVERARLIREKDRYQEHLEMEVKERTRELQVSNDRLNQEIETRKKTEADLKGTQLYLTQLFDSLPAMLVSLDSQGRVIHWNKAAEKYTQVPAAQAFSQVVWQLIPFVKPFAPVFEEVLVSQTSQEMEKEIPIRAKKRYLYLSIHPLNVNQEKGAVLRIEDITEAKKKDEHLRQAQKMETVGILAGGLAHDFNNVLGGINGPISIIQDDIKGKKGSPDVLKSLLEDVEKSANRAADIVKHLLALSRKEELTFERVDLNTVIKHVMHICQNTFDKSILLDPLFAPRMAEVYADHVQIEQVLLNLCVNGAHAMTIMRTPGQPWGGRLSIFLDRVYLDRHLPQGHQPVKEGYYWKLSVKDEGVGMSVKTRTSIFTPFFTTKSNGTGLGLAMVYNIVMQHKGSIEVESSKNQGSTFDVYLPEMISTGRRSKKSRTETIIYNGKGLILVVEDEPIMQKVATRILQDAGYLVITAKDGHEAVGLFEKYHPEIALVLLDMLMPKKSGKETYIEMKKIDPHLKVLLNSGFRKDARIEEAMHLGIKDFIEKPYTKHQLLKAVHQAMSR
jgi:PAS domain S-box-containing protein